ncbi:MAG TPA: type IV toxin-antitoxin system AbiEi family antitoxin domain-containing protein [Acidimicrobiia bacterium]|nr:type IV toxin-antitoxin system AbiEi family antitoxin domain-containing protein [Acidimicrobiia bacterium]
MDFDRDVRRLASQQYGLANRRQIRAFGGTGRQIAHRVEKGILAPITHEVFELVGTPASEGKSAMAAVLDAPLGAVLSHTSAAAWWDIPSFRIDNDLHVTIPRQGSPHRGRLAMIHYHKGLPPDHLMTLRGIPVTSPTLTIFHLAAILSPRRTARACDNGWSMRLFDGLDLHHLLKILGASGRNGIANMREILDQRPPDYVPPQSGLEARYCQLVVEDGMPEPRRQVNIFGPRWIGRADFEFDDLPLVIELLSVRFHASLLDSQADRERFDAFRRAGKHVIAFWDFEVWHNPRFVVRETRKARELLKAGAKLPADDPFSRAERAR